jgi:hypothetical protein
MVNRAIFHILTFCAKFIFIDDIISSLGCLIVTFMYYYEQYMNIW